MHPDWTLQATMKQDSAVTKPFFWGRGGLGGRADNLLN